MIEKVKYEKVIDLEINIFICNNCKKEPSEYGSWCYDYHAVENKKVLKVERYLPSGWVTMYGDIKHKDRHICNDCIRIGFTDVK